MQNQNKAVFLDRDGVLNREIGDYVFRAEQFEVLPGVPQALHKLKDAGYKLIVVTNQGGIGKGLFTHHDFELMMQLLVTACGPLFDKVYYAPLHRTHTRSLSSKPDSLMIEKGLAKFRINPAVSYIAGDAERDLQAGKKAGLQTILIPSLKETESPFADFTVPNLLTAADLILSREAI